MSNELLNACDFFSHWDTGSAVRERSQCSFNIQLSLPNSVQKHELSSVPFHIRIIVAGFSPLTTFYANPSLCVGRSMGIRWRSHVDAEFVEAVGVLTLEFVGSGSNFDYE